MAHSKRMLQLRGKLVYNKAVGDKYYKAGIIAPRIAKAAKPGQFVMVKVAGGVEPLLRRPFGVHRVRGKTLEILYEVVGQGTHILSGRKAGECVDIIGPLGNGFNLRNPKPVSRNPILVAGGMGIAPLAFLAEKIKGKRVTILIGAKTKSHILCEKELHKIGCKVKIATDDGSRGFKGKVTDLLKHILRVTSYELRVTMYACGPRPMLKEISRISQARNIPAQVSLEEHMACGIGACLGCVVHTIDGYKRVCKEGPVFDASRIIWEVI